MNEETSVVRKIGRYHAVGELGRGGMGIVYKGFDPVIGRTVALKTIGITGQDAEAKQLRERLYREASAAGTLTHPNIVTIYDVIEDGETTAVAMEFVEGKSLADLLADKGPLPLDRALELFEQICAALDYAGAKGIIHRDIKPANILLTPDGHAKITDFGIARMAVSGLTQTGTIMGSPSYMSPEQVRGAAARSAVRSVFRGRRALRDAHRRAALRRRRCRNDDVPHRQRTAEGARSRERQHSPGSLDRPGAGPRKEPRRTLPEGS